MSRIKVDRITDKAGTGAPILVNGMNVTGKSTMGDIIGAAVTFNSITGGSANFSSDVSIGGTLTYEDVKNVDSVGLITARSGVKVQSGGIDVTAGGVTVTAGGIDINAGGLDVTGPTKAYGNGSASIEWGDTGYSGHLSFDGSSNAVIRSASGKALIFQTNHGSERLRIASGGAVGLSGANYGTSGQVMTSQGASAAPQWADAGGGAWSLLSSVSNPNTSTVDFVGLTTTYAAYKVQYINASINTNNVREMRCRIYLGGTLQTSGYRNLSSTIGVGQAGSPGAYAGLTGAILLSGAGNGARGYNGEITFPMKLRTSGAIDSMQAFYGTSISHDFCTQIGGFHENSYSTLLTGIAFDSPDPYNITDGQFYLYGLTRT